MAKNIAAVIVGYVVTAVCVIAVFTLAYKLLGAEGSFYPESYEVSALYAVIAIVVGILAAMLGGYVCMAISRNRKAVLSLAILMVVLGAVSAGVELSQAANKKSGPRLKEVSDSEALMNARQPVWMLFLNPLLGFAGVLIGGRLKRVAPPAGDSHPA